MNRNIDRLRSSPIGTLVPTEKDQLAFLPHNLPRTIELPANLVYLLDQATRSVASLNTALAWLPNANPHLLMRPFMRREAVLSSQIEGTQTTLEEVILFEASENQQRATPDLIEVMNYVRALDFGLRRMEHLPLSKRLTNELHRELMTGARSYDRRPGEIRTEQVFIGGAGTTIDLARFIPPPASFVEGLLDDWEAFINADIVMPPLIQVALMHYQFETIHPYRDGNGRVGRLLIILFLAAKLLLDRPLLYLSAYFERNKQRYFDDLFELSVTGNWLPWIDFFLTGVIEESRDVLDRSQRLRELFTGYRQVLREKNETANALSLLEELFARPVITAPAAAKAIGVTPAAGRRILERLQDAGVVRVERDQWPHYFVASEVYRVFTAPTSASI